MRPFHDCTTWTLFFFCGGGQTQWHGGTGGAVCPYLPLLELVLLGLVLLDQVIQDLLQPLGIRPQGGHDILDGPLHQDAIYHAEALAVAGKGVQGLKNKSAGAVSDER